MRYLLPLLLLMASCKMPPGQAKETYIKVGATEVHHDGNSEKAPVVTDKSNTDKVDVPAGSEITVTESKGAVTVTSPGGKPVEVPVDTKITTIRLPATAGATITSTKADVSITGSTGHAPPPPPTPYEESLSAWTYGGIALFALGIFFCTPWGGSHYRVGALVSLGGVAMSATGYLLNEITQIGLPKWFPAVGLLGAAAGIVLYWGYRLRQKQVTEPTQPQP